MRSLQIMLAATVLVLLTYALTAESARQDAERASSCKHVRTEPMRLAVREYLIDTKPGKDQAGAVLEVMPERHTYLCADGRTIVR